MGLFDIFKKKPEPQPEKQTLEVLLQKSAKEPAYRPEFYKRLLTDELVVVHQDIGLPEGVQTLKEKTTIKLLTHPDGKIPVFTSKERIFDKGIVKVEVNYLQMKGEELFSLVKGATLLLNPYSDNSKELLPEEIEMILSGKILSETSKTITIKEETKVMLGQPTKYPTEVVNSLKILYGNKPEVNTAYLGWIYDPSSGDPAHYIFAIDAEGDFQSIAHETGFTIKQILNTGEIFDIIKVDKGGLSDYFVKRTTPFYKR